MLSGDPSKPGPYAFEIRVPANTKIAAHLHRDNRNAIVVSGEWHFGYGNEASDAAAITLGPGAFYTEPAGVNILRLSNAPKTSRGEMPSVASRSYERST